MSPLTDALPRLPGATSARQAAAARAEAAGLPSTDAEEWRYSRVDELDLSAWAPLVAAPEGVSPEVPAGQWAATLVVADGWVLDHQTHDDAVTIATAADDPALGSVMTEAHDALAEWSVALAPSPTVIRIARGRHVDDPICVVTHHATIGGLSAPRIVVVVEEGASATLVEVQTSADGAALVLPLVEIDVAARARLQVTTVQRHSSAVWQVANQVARVGQEGHLTSSLVALGGDYSRVRTDCRLDGRGASGELRAAYFGERDQTLDFRTFQDHQAPDTHSDLLFKGAVGGRSRSIYTGLITVRPDAKGTNAFQTNRNLKLSEEAWAESVPNLEIQNNDVRCSHASTVGPIDDDQRFYLESRGIPPTVAERLVVAGFFSDVLDRMPGPASVLDPVRAAIDERLDRQVDAHRSDDREGVTA